MGGTSVGNFFKKYRDYIHLNKNITIAGTAAFFASAFVSQYYSLYDDSSIANSILALVTEYVIYIPLFAYLFYRDNRQRYIDAAGKRDSKRLRGDVKKLFAAFSVSEIIYSVARAYVHYALMQTGTEPYQASMIASMVAWGVFFVSINASVKLVRLFKKA
jgi:hypothetical protein